MRTNMNCVNSLKSRRRLRFWLFLWLVLAIFSCVTGWLGLIRWRVPSLPPNVYPESPVFQQVRNSDTYLYSAVVNMAPDGSPDPTATATFNLTVPRVDAGKRNAAEEEEKSYNYIVKELDQNLEIVLTGLDRSRSWPSSFVCCVIDSATAAGDDNKQHNKFPHVFASMASTYFEYVKPLSWGKYINEYWLGSEPSVYVATQYSCRFPRSHMTSPNSRPALATLAPMPSLLARALSPLLLLAWPWRSYQSYCPRDESDYLPVVYPRKAPNDLALCSKVNHNGAAGDGLDPEVLTEWFELQRHLGVDRVLVYDMGDNSQEMKSVFKHYKKLGLLDLQPYDLPGEPLERTLAEEHKKTAQFNQDETMAVLECRLRTSGHGLVLSLDKDEVLVPRKDVSLKEMLLAQFRRHPHAAALVFMTQFFITTWPPSHPVESLLVLRFQQTRKVRWECWKYAFRPTKVKATVTHEAFPKRGFSSQRISSEHAVLHHYRACPRDTWGTCDVSSNMDHTMSRYKQVLTKRVKVARDQVLAQLLDREEEDEEDDR